MTIDECKTDKSFPNLKALATALAQSLYYIRCLKFLEVEKPIPFFICTADKKEATLTGTYTWINYYTNDNYDWDRSASKPDPKLIDHLVKEPESSKIHVYDVTKISEHEAFKTNLDRITDESQRRFEGEFYTPLRFAKKAIHYLTDVTGKNWYRTGKYKIWDMAAGTGNLEYHLAIDEIKDLSKSNENLAAKILPNITKYGFLDRDEVFD
jgi:hypothetical protein